MRYGSFLGYLAVALLALSFSPRARAGSTVEQVVTTKLGTESSTAKYLWNIDGEKFKLKVVSAKAEVSYLFNGRNFYVCGKVGDDVIAQLKALKVTDAQFLKDLVSGSCQAVPANFMARFFLSPAGAISTLDYSDGMELTLAMQNYGFKDEGKGQANKESCSMASRNFEVTRKIDQADGRYQKVDEKICFTEKYDWRKPFWKQMSRNLIRQPSAKGLYKSLEEDSTKLQGFVLHSTGTFEKSDAKGVMRKGSLTIETTSVKDGAIAPGELSTPTGFAIVDIQSKIASSRMGDATDGKGYEVEKDPVPVILYFLLTGAI